MLFALFNTIYIICVTYCTLLSRYILIIGIGGKILTASVF